MRVFLSLLFAAALGCSFSADAQAGSYAVWACADGQGAPLSAGDWMPSTTAAQGVVSSTCGVGGLSSPGNLQAIVGRADRQADGPINAMWKVTAAPGTTISALDVWWTNSAGVQIPGRIQVYAGDQSLFMRDTGSFGSIATPLADADRQSFTGLAAPSASLVAWCLSSCAALERAIASLFNAYRVRTVVTDPAPPTGEVSGVADGQSVSGPLTITARAADAGSGVLDLQLLVDGRVVDSRASGRASCQDLDPEHGDALEYALMKPCLTQLPDGAAPPATFTVSLAQLATAGPHNVSVVAHDAAGNAGTLMSSTVIVPPAALDGPAPPTLYDARRGLFFNPDLDLAAQARPNGLNASLANVRLLFVVKRVRRVRGHRRTVKTFTRRRTVGYNAAARLRGRVTTPSGAPIVGARVYRAISVAGGPWRLIPKALVTSKTGRVSVRLAERSPSRRVKLVYFPTTDSNVSSRSKSARMAVRAPLSLSVARRVVPRGGRIVMTARLRAGRRPGRSVLGVLQVRRHGAWQTIRQLRFTGRGRSGRGVATVVLRLHTPAAYRFRVAVSPQASLRQTRGASARRVVRVT